MPNSTENEKWNELFQNQSSKVNEHVDPHQPELIDNYFFIYDCIQNEIAFVNNAFKTLTGYDVKTFNLDKLIQIIHPDDLDYFFKCEERDLEFTNNLSFNQHFQYLFSYTYRIIAANGTVMTIQQHCQAIEVTNQGHLSKTLVTHKRIEDYTERPANDHKAFDKARGIYIDSENCYGLSKREVEILTLIKEGLNSQEISSQLNISKYTIDTHRKNILNKTNSTNFIELIHKLSFTKF
ncbi:MAG: PAS domain-containing protein [Weeksellaceae bacterium]|nr:PAS domain-containing protein [Weeksellaceae bacterium]